MSWIGVITIAGVSQLGWFCRALDPLLEGP
jgi:hypothetical protein